MRPREDDDEDDHREEEEEHLTQSAIKRYGRETPYRCTSIKMFCKGDGDTDYTRCFKTAGKVYEGSRYDMLLCQDCIKMFLVCPDSDLYVNGIGRCNASCSIDHKPYQCSLCIDNMRIQYTNMNPPPTCACDKKQILCPSHILQCSECDEWRCYDPQLKEHKDCPQHKRKVCMLGDNANCEKCRVESKQLTHNDDFFEKADGIVMHNPDEFEPEKRDLPTRSRAEAAMDEADVDVDNDEFLASQAY